MEKRVLVKVHIVRTYEKKIDLLEGETIEDIKGVNCMSVNNQSADVIVDMNSPSAYQMTFDKCDPKNKGITNDGEVIKTQIMDLDELGNFRDIVQSIHYRG